MANPRWSASRFGTYNSCKMKYKLQYIDCLRIEGRSFDVQQKGLVFHHIAENTQIGESFESLMARANTEIANAEYDKEKYPVEKSIPVFYYWWHKYVEEPVAAGFTLAKEEWKNFELADATCCGALDLLLVKKEFAVTADLAEKLINEGKAIACENGIIRLNEKATSEDIQLCNKSGTNHSQVIIMDYKTGSAAKLSDTYKNQLLLYTYAMSKELGISIENIAKQIKCYLFYPLAGIKNLDVTDQAKIEKFALKNTLRFDFTVDMFRESITGFEKAIFGSNTRDWSSMAREDMNLSSDCSFCPFCGHPRLCPISYEAGCTFPHSAKIIQPESN